MNSPSAVRPISKSPGAAGQIGEVYYEVRWPDGRRFDSRKKVNKDQADLLVDAGVCDEVRSPSGLLRYLRPRRNPQLKHFISILAQANFTTTKTGNLHEHTASKRRGI